MHFDVLEIPLSLPEFVFLFYSNEMETQTIRKWKQLGETQQKRSLLCFLTPRVAPFPSKRVHFSVRDLRIPQFPQSGRYGIVILQWHTLRRQSPLVNPRHGALLFSAPAAAAGTQPLEPQAAPLTGSRSQKYSDVLMQLYHWPGHYHGRFWKQSLHLSVSPSQEIPLHLGLGSSLPLHFGVFNIQVTHGPVLNACNTTHRGVS